MIYQMTELYTPDNLGEYDTGYANGFRDGYILAMEQFGKAIKRERGLKTNIQIIIDDTLVKFVENK